MNEIPLILFGLGGVGRSFVRQILDLRDYHADKYDLHLRFLAFCDSRGAVLEPTEGFSDQQVHELLQLKEQGGSLSQHLLGGIQDDLAAIVDIAGQPGTIVVDCTATEATVPALFLALDRNYQVVLANKKPLTMQQEVYDRLTRAGTTAGDPITLSQSRWETTVGAGLPVIATLNRLVASGDEIVRIAGAFSGTLGYVMTGLQEGRAFSEIVQDAYRQGYTEPDPRDDLGGVDVARKALILARGMGWRLDLSDVSVQSLYPEALAERTVDEFLEALPGLDAGYKEKVDQAAADGKVLRYAATIADGACRVGLTAVGRESPLGRLTGTDNLVAFSTRWYNPNPLVIQGRGAGVDATAAGVLSDVVELAFVG